MKKFLLLFALLSAACLSYAGDDKTAADKAKCDEKAAKCCCCKDDKACAKDHACTDKKDEKPAAATPGKP